MSKVILSAVVAAIAILIGGGYVFGALPPFWSVFSSDQSSSNPTSFDQKATQAEPKIPLSPTENPSSLATDIEVSDRITHPPARQTLSAAPYELVIETQDNWQTPQATGQLFRGDTLLWQKALPHQYGPRFFLVSPNAQVILFDEYINVASPYAIALIDATGTPVAQYSFDDIQTALQPVSRNDLTQQATSGWWISAPPRLTESGEKALVKTGGTTLEIDLTTGALSRRDDL